MWSGNETDPKLPPRSKLSSARRLTPPAEYEGELQDFSGTSQWMKVGSKMLRREVASDHNPTLVGCAR